MKRPIEREAKRDNAKREPIKYKMKAAPNWETVDVDAEETPDRFRIDPSILPEGMSFQWVTDSVYGQPQPQHRADFEKKGWTPVHQTDFDGQFNGMFMPRDRDGEILMDGMVLMARPQELTDKARRKDRRKAMEQVLIKENSLRAGDMPVTLDAAHPTAVRFNNISKSIERIEIPEE